MMQAIQLGRIILVPLLLQLVGATIAVTVDNYIERTRRRIMLIIIALVFTLVVQEYMEFLLIIRWIRPRIRTLVSIYGYIVRPAILVLFIRIVGRGSRAWPCWVLTGVNAAIYLTAIVSDISISISPDNRFIRGPLGYSCHVVSAVLLAYLLYLTIREYGRVRKSEAWIPVFNVLLIAAATVLDSTVSSGDEPMSYLAIAVVSSGVFFYIWLHLQFVREHERALMAELRIQIMISQIQPHFLFNTLSTIQALCRIDPKAAFDTVGKFSVYLRQNLESLNKSDLIPFRKELDHTRVYADIEMLRFPSIKVEYQVEDDDFMLPALSLQPLVENAIRHGVRVREDGRVSIIARRDADCHTIIVQDNGKGFDVAAAAAADETHIGVRNVKERLERMCGGTLTIASRIGEGTEVTIRIPMEKGSGAQGDADALRAAAGTRVLNAPLHR